MENVFTPKINLLYNDISIIKDFSPYLQEITYHDFLEDESDELTVKLKDDDKLFQNYWYPQKGARLTCSIAGNEEILNCGTFTIDSVRFLFNETGDTLEIRAIAATTNLPLRTVRSDYYEKTTASGVAKKIAERHGLDFFTNEIPNSDNILKIDRITQTEETDLGFLRRLSKEYGYIFKLTNNLLSFIKIYDDVSLYTLKKPHFSSLKFEDESVKKYKGGEINYYNPEKKSLQTVKIGDSTKDILKLRKKFTSHAQGLQILESQLRLQSTEVKASVKLSNPLGKFIAGIKFNLEGFGIFDGRYLIKETLHKITPNQWIVNGEIEKEENLNSMYLLVD